MISSLSPLCTNLNGTDSPAGAYYQSIVGTEYDWNFTTVSQPNLANRRISQPRGRVSNFPFDGRGSGLGQPHYSSVDPGSAVFVPLTRVLTTMADSRWLNSHERNVPRQAFKNGDGRLERPPGLQWR